MTSIGARDIRVDFKRRGVTESARGEMQAGAGEVFYRAKAAVNFGRAVERREAGALDSTQMATARVRRTAKSITISDDDIMTMAGDDWEVTSIARYGRAFLDITVKRKVVRGN